MDALVQFLHVSPLLVAVILIVISALYFRAGRNLSAQERVLKSAHGVLLSAQLAPVLARDLLTPAYGGWLVFVFYGALFVGLAAVVYSLRGLARPWYFHVLHVVTIFYAALANVYGYQALPR